MILYYRKNYKIWWFLKKQIWMSRLGRLSYFATGGEDGTAILRPNAPPEIPPAPRQCRPPVLRAIPATSAAKAAAFPSPELPPNALRRRADPGWRGGFSMGVDLGGARTGLALSKGFVPRPLTVKSAALQPPLSLSLYCSSSRLFWILMDSIELYRCWSFGGRGLSSDYLRLQISRFKARFFSLFQELQMFFIFVLVSTFSYF